MILYGGGQFELGIGRDQIQALASLLYADGPNDVAPREYHGEAHEEVPGSPLVPLRVAGAGLRVRLRGLRLGGTVRRRPRPVAAAAVHAGHPVQEPPALEVRDALAGWHPRSAAPG